MPASTYKPLFNRRYLFALMWIIPIVILLLHATGREKAATPLSLGWHADPDHWRLSYETLPDIELRALKPFAPGWNLPNTLERAHLLQSLKHWLNEESTLEKLDELSWQATLQSLTSAVQLSITMSQPPSDEQIAWLTSALNQRPNVELNEQQRLMATWQLDQRQAENRLLAEFEHWLFSDQPTSHAFTNEWTFLLSGANVVTSNETDIPPRSTLTPILSAKELTEQAHVSQVHHLLAWHIPLSEDSSTLAKHRASINAIQQALENLPQRPNYRLIWNPLPPKSYLIIITQGQPDNRLDDQLLDLLLGETSDRLLSDAIKQVVDQYQPATASVINAVEWFELSALLGFPLNSDLIYSETIKQLSNDDIRQHLVEMLDRQHQFSLTLTPY